MKDPKKLLIFVLEAPNDLLKEQYEILVKYLNEDVDFNIKVVPLLSDIKTLSFRCVYPSIPDDDVISVLEKAAECENGELSKEAKNILRSLKLMKIKG